MAMLNQLKEGLEQALGSLSEGWRELSQRATGALTRFKPGSAGSDHGGESSGDLPTMSAWAFMAADVFEDDDNVVVRLEAPGMQRDDFVVEVQGEMVSVRGEKRFQREPGGGRYRVVQCAYGTFHREILLPVRVQTDKTKATYREGVLRIEMPKAEGKKTSTRVDVHEG